MLMQTEDQMLGAAAEVHLAARTKGIAAGTVVATADGYLPVDFLSPGDRVVTRHGMRGDPRHPGAALHRPCGAHRRLGAWP